MVGVSRVGEGGQYCILQKNGQKNVRKAILADICLMILQPRGITLSTKFYFFLGKYQGERWLR